MNVALSAERSCHRRKSCIAVPDFRKLIIGVLIALAVIGLFPADCYSFEVSRQQRFDNGQPTDLTLTDNLVELLRLMTKRRLTQCFGAKSQCFSSTQCCRGHVCVVTNDHFAYNPETPGTCVREKDLTLCSTDLDCPMPRSRCASLGRTGQYYCVALSASVARHLIVAPPHTIRQINKSGGLGSACLSSSDCNEHTSDGRTALCCQLVHRHRQGTRQQCDRLRPPISVCL